MPDSKPKSIKKTKTSQKKKKIRWSHLVLLVLMLLGIVGASAVGTVILAAMSSMPDLDDAHIGDYDIPSKIYDKNGDIIQELSLGNNYSPVKTNEMSQLIRSAVISVEDKRFHDHHGIDPIRITGAMISNFKSGGVVQGGSTITQQLAGMAMNSRDEKTYKRKIQEAITAIKIDKRYSKADILTMYLNRCYFGIGLSGRSCYGVEAASNDYFGKHATDLTLEEAALLAGMIQNPGKWSPLVSVDNAKERRGIVLKAMLDNGVISQEQFTNANAADIPVSTILETTEKKILNDTAISYTDYTINEAMHVLGLKSDKDLYTGGYQIYTQMNPNLQDYMYNYFSNDYNFPTGNSTQPIQGAMIVMDSKKGEIIGLIGGRNIKQERTLNRTKTLRQPGSTFKPIYAYAPAFENGYGTGSVELDKPYDAWGHIINNYDFKYAGMVTFRQALINSYNTVAVRVVAKVGSEKGVAMAKKLGITSLVEEGTLNDVNLSAGLGGLTKGVSVEEMAGAYGVFANQGYYNKPHTIVKILNQQGKVVYTADNKPKQVISPETAYMITSCLTDVVNRGTGVLARIYDGRVTAGKTGTTDNAKDLWFVGYTPQYVGCVWIGFDQPAQIYSTSDATSRIFGSIMSYLHQGLPYEDFVRPDNVVSVLIDTKTGNLASRSTPGIYRSMELFKSGTEPSSYSSYSGGWYDSSSNNTGTVNSYNTETSTTQDTTTNNADYSNSNNTETTQVENSSEDNSDALAGLPAA